MKDMEHAIIKNIVTSLLTAVAAFAPTGGALGGEVLYNGIVLPDNWPPCIDAMFPGPQTPHYLKSPPAAIRIDVGRQLFVDDFLVASSEGVVRKFYKPVKFDGNPVRFRFRMKVATLYAFWVSKDASGKSGGYLAAGGPDYAGPKDE